MVRQAGTSHSSPSAPWPSRADSPLAAAGAGTAGGGFGVLLLAAAVPSPCGGIGLCVTASIGVSKRVGMSESGETESCVADERLMLGKAADRRPINRSIDRLVAGMDLLLATIEMLDAMWTGCAVEAAA